MEFITCLKTLIQKCFSTNTTINQETDDLKQNKSLYYTIDCDQIDSFQAQQKLLGLIKNEQIIIFDVGAHIGTAAKKYRQIFPESTIYCLEPFPESFKKLTNIIQNDKQIFCIKNAISYENSSKVFYSNSQAATNSLFPRPKNKRRYYPKSATPEGTIEVETITLDNFSQANNIQNIDILKMDIQGGELNALKGAIDLLSSGKILIIYTEIMFVPHYEGGTLFYDLSTFLSQYGYTIYNMYNISSAKNGQVRQGDAIFISDAFRKNYLDLLDEEI